MSDLSTSPWNSFRAFFMIHIGKIESVSNSKVSKFGGGFLILFESLKNLHLGEFICIKHDDKEYSFEVWSTESNGGVLSVVAKENGYWLSALRNNKTFDIRLLHGVDLYLVTDAKEIERIKTESNWC